MLTGSFFTILISSFGFTTEQTLLLGMVNAYVAFFMIGMLWLGDKVKNRCLVSIVPSVISAIGALLVWLLPSEQRVARLVGFYL